MYVAVKGKHPMHPDEPMTTFVELGTPLPIGFIATEITATGATLRDAFEASIAAAAATFAGVAVP
jgi:hypothetical protein